MAVATSASHLIPSKNGGVSSRTASTLTIRPASAQRSYGSTDKLPRQVLNSDEDTLQITIDRPTTPRASDYGYTSSSTGQRPQTVIPPLHAVTNYRPSWRSEISIFLTQTVSFFISSFFLTWVVIWASIVRLYHQIPKWLRPTKPPTYEWDRLVCREEKVVKDIRIYAQCAGFDIIDEQIETEDGFYLRVHRVVNPRHKQNSDGRGGYPVLLLHGLFQSSGSFVTSEERSLAFWLSEHAGYQVFLGNTRSVFNMGHKYLRRSDPRFWDWTIRELALYDFPALVNYVRDTTGYDKIAFIGHSQGNGLAFISLGEGMCPEIGDKLSCFIALAPAVFAGPLTQGFLFTSLKRLEWTSWKRIFGVLDFIPLMQWAYGYVPASMFAFFGYTMFAFLFKWTDANWLPRRKTKMFRFTPAPVSSASIFWWCGKGGFAERGCTMDEGIARWWCEEGNFPPLCLWSGGRDYLVCVDKLVERIKEKEKGVRVLRVEKIEDSEHCDFYWAAEAVEWCFEKIMDDIEKTRSDKANVGVPLNYVING